MNASHNKRQIKAKTIAADDRGPRSQPVRRVRLIGICLVLLTLAVYARSLGNGFVDYDDNQYITINETVQQGLTLNGVGWALTSFKASNWHPVTWVSHMLDVSVFDLRPWGHHLVNVLLHAANTWLLLLILVRMTGAVWRSAFVAAMFAVHPLHVESVAWVAERKDVLSTLFGLLAILAYLRWVRTDVARGRTLAYCAMLVAFALSLMAKPMLVTLPAVLFLLDVWPLRRLPSLGGSASISTLLIEKIPLLAMSIASSVITIIAQQRGGVVTSVEQLSIAQRAANAIVAYATYLQKTIWPLDLAAIYPHPGQWTPTTIALSLLFLVVLSVISGAFALRKNFAPLIGWLFFLGTLVPVIGLVQVGSQAMADRYTYVPLIGVFIMVAWAVPELHARSTRIATATVASLAVIVASVLSVIQIGYWRESVTLFQRALAVTDDNYIAHVNLSFTLAKQSAFDQAANHFSKALAINPPYTRDNDFVGRELLAQERWNDAQAHYEKLLRVFPDHPSVHMNLAGVHASHGRELLRQNRPRDAAAQLRQAVELQPNDSEKLRDLGLALAASGELDQAIQTLRAALAINPNDELAQELLRTALEQQRSNSQ